MSSDDYKRTFIDSVNRIIGQVGEMSVGALTNPTRRVEIAMTAIQEARDEVWYDATWSWRHGHMKLVLVDGLVWYALPDDYESMDTGPVQNATEAPFTFLNYHRFIEKYPNIQTWPPGTGMDDSYTQAYLQAQRDANVNYGRPVNYTVDSGYLGIMPAPDQAFLAEFKYLFATYWKSAPPLVSANDELGVPHALLGSVHKIALGNMRAAIEFSDGQSDVAIGQLKLRKAKSRGMTATNDLDINSRPSINYNE